MEVSLELERTIAGKFQEAHDASKASIQSRISNLESGGVKGTSNSKYTTKIKWGINDIEARPYGKGYWEKEYLKKIQELMNLS